MTSDSVICYKKKREKIKTQGFLTVNSSGLRFENDCCLPEAMGSMVSAVFDRWLATERI